MLAHRLQRIGIEECVALEGDAAKEAVIERALQYVVIFGIAMEQEQAVVDIDIADGSTGLAVGAHVGQLVILAESLATGGGTNATGDVELLANNIVPDLVDGVDVVLITRQGSHIGHAGIHIGSTDSVANGLVLLNDGLMALRILIPNLCLATIVE